MGRLSNLRWYAVFATGVILAAVYMCGVYQRIMFPVRSPTRPTRNIRICLRTGIVIMAPLLCSFSGSGIYPNTFFDKMNPALEQLLEQMNNQQVAIVEVVQPVVANVVDSK